jgi:hypothetical protein
VKPSETSILKVLKIKHRPEAMIRHATARMSVTC